MADAQSVPRLGQIHDDEPLTAMTTPPSDRQLIDFVVREARLLDEQRFEEWLDLFAEDGRYWMPLEWGQSDPRLTCSLMYEQTPAHHPRRTAERQPHLQSETQKP